MAATDHRTAPAAGEAAEALRRPRRPGGADRLTVTLVTIAAFLSVLALLGREVRDAPRHVSAHRVVLIRRVYRTTVRETIVGGQATAAGPAVTQSVSSSGSASSVASAPTTRTS